MVKKCHNNKIYDHFERQAQEREMIKDRMGLLAQSINKTLSAQNVRHKLFLSQLDPIGLLFWRYELLVDLIKKHPDTFTEVCVSKYGKDAIQVQSAFAKFVNNMMNYLGTHLEDLMVNHGLAPHSVVHLVELCDTAGIDYFKTKALNNFLIVQKLQK